MTKQKINVVGAGLAGVEVAFALANFGYEVNLYEQKPKKMSPAHHEELFAELVCSNSLKSNELDSACGLLKEEMRKLKSLTMEAATFAQIPSGQALGVDRHQFSTYITEKIRNNHNIIIHEEEIENIIDDEITIYATGPLTDGKLFSNLGNYLGQEFLGFFDAAAPIIDSTTIDKNKCYEKSRYDKGDGGYLNCPMNKEEYELFCRELVNAKRVTLHDFEHFESCLPVEVIASRGSESLRFGPLKPKGLEVEGKEYPYAVVQLRQEDNFKHLYGLVGFQTNLTYAEQKRVFSLIPGLENAKFVRYGLMHRNSYICAPKVLNRDMSLKKNNNIFIAGQLSGVEGYVESAASGLIIAYYIHQRLQEKKYDEIPLSTMLGSLLNYIVMASSKSFAPMNANFGVMLNLKKDRFEMAKTSLSDLQEWLKNNV